VLVHIKKLDDCFGQFLVRVTCKCGTVREITPEALAHLVGWSTNLESLAQNKRCSPCGEKAADVVAVAKSRPRSVPKNAHQRMKLSTSRLCVRIASKTAAALLAQINHEI
jgi:hypothetical protein